MRPFGRVIGPRQLSGAIHPHSVQSVRRIPRYIGHSGLKSRFGTDSQYSDAHQSKQQFAHTVCNRRSMHGGGNRPFARTDQRLWRPLQCLCQCTCRCKLPARQRNHPPLRGGRRNNRPHHTARRRQFQLYRQFQLLPADTLFPAGYHRGNRETAWWSAWKPPTCWLPPCAA